MFKRPKIVKIPETPDNFIPKEKTEDFVLIGPPTLLDLYYQAKAEIRELKRNIKRIENQENILWHKLYD